MPHLDRDGVRIRFDCTGEGPVVLLSHGYLATRHMWGPNVAALAAAGHTVVTWDQRGHGDSDYPDDDDAYGESMAVGDMAAILDEVGADRAVVAGMSLGGYLSLAFHLAHPERTAALVLVDTGPGFKSDDARAAWNRTAEQYAADFTERGLDALPVSAGRSEVDPSVHRDATGLVHAARGLMVQRDARVISSLPAIAVPTLVVVGDADLPFLAAADYVTAKVPGARKVVIEGAGHASNVDQPEAFNRAVTEFLATLSWAS
jgi:pimeloyl-ACP methyl ester carboxylesterase